VDHTHNVISVLHGLLEIYPDPEEFKPERFLNEDGCVRDDPTLSLAFGVGKRICPGCHLAEATIFIVASSVLSVFNVANAKDEVATYVPLIHAHMRCHAANLLNGVFVVELQSFHQCVLPLQNL
jgi:cytochrome P450